MSDTASAREALITSAQKTEGLLVALSSISSPSHLVLRVHLSKRSKPTFLSQKVAIKANRNTASGVTISGQFSPSQVMCYLLGPLSLCSSTVPKKSSTSAGDLKKYCAAEP